MHRTRLALLPLLLACGGRPPEAPRTPPPAEPAPPPAEPAPPPAEPAPSPTPSEPQPPFQGTAGDTRVDRPGPVATLREVRTGRHEGFDRVVFELAERVPGYHVAYVDRPVRRCGSGQEVPLPGDAWLEVRLEPARAHTDEGRATVTDRSRPTPDLALVRQIEGTCDFEAQVTWVLAVSSPHPYRVLELTGPPRLVIDVRH